MKDDPLDVRQAIADVALLRRVLHQIEQKRTDQESAGLFGTTLNANMLLQGGALCVALALAIIEIFSNNASSLEPMILGNESLDLRLAGIGIVALMLLGMITALYFVLWRAARHNGEEFGAYIARNFRYARHVSYLSDLLMKFFAVALVLLAGQSQWVAPLLMAFTGDYLLQGRLFTLPTKSRGGTRRNLHRWRTATIFESLRFIANSTGCIFGNQRIFCREVDLLIPNSRRVDGIRR